MLPTTKEQLAGCIDYALLNPLCTRGDVETHCRQAVSYGFCAVCVLPQWTALAADILHGSKVKVAGQVGVDFVKTSTGLLSAGGATVEAVELMARSAPNCRIKAAGGITTVQQAMDMLAAGASRIGASTAVQIIDSFNGEAPGK